MRKYIWVCISIVSIFLLYLILRNSFIKLGEIKPRIADGNLVFDINYKDTNGLSSLYLYEFKTKKTCWVVRLNYYYKSKLLYGDVPQGFTTYNGVINNAKQVLPEKSVLPSNLLEGKIYKIQAIWQYDKYISAMSGSTIIYFTIKNESVALLSQQEIELGSTK